jgi:hypothetical protein
MVPGISAETEARLAQFLRPEVTDLRPDSLVARPFALLAAGDAEAQRLGINLVAPSDLTIVVTDPARPVGNIRVLSAGKNNVMFFDNAGWTGQCNATIRILGSDCALLFNNIGDGYVGINDLLMRSSGQVLFWGSGATAVGISIEIEGNGRSCVIGDDALISNDVWIRNYDMHAMHDLATGAQINRPPCDTLLERHVWLGQDTLLLHCEQIGMGTIIGARALVKGRFPPRVVVTGTPGRVVREGISWGRSADGMTNAERAAIGVPPV